MDLSDSRLFLQGFLRHPGQVGSIVPSSRFLGGRMIGEVPWQEVRAVAELGSGTGAITSLIDRKAADTAQVLLFEKDARMREKLERRYPRFTCCPNAAQLLEAVAEQGIDRLDCVISGLPFFNFPQQLRERLLSQIRLALKPRGYFVAFQYSLQMKKQLAQEFDIEAVRFVPLNLPPAFVYVCRNRD